MFALADNAGGIILITSAGIRVHCLLPKERGNCVTGCRIKWPSNGGLTPRWRILCLRYWNTGSRCYYI